MKLLVISIVASNLLGFANNFSVNCALFDLSLFKLSTSFGANEKYATSAPETTAEQNNIIIITMKLITISIEISCNLSSKKGLNKSRLSSSSNACFYLSRKVNRLPFLLEEFLL